MSDGTVISAQNVSKAYRIWETPAARLTVPMMQAAARFMPGAGALRALAATRYRDFWALRDVSFELKKGESLGIIGRNGSGKSTLLQIIAGTLQPTEGSVTVKGRVAALLELGSGFNPEFSGRENVYLNGTVLGFTRAEIDARFDDIAAFADIGDFIDQPVKTYSSGMMVRLAFAVQSAVEPEILIVDEALSVGDVFFQQKCYQRMHKLLDQGMCIILASHDLASVQRYCHRTLVFRRGRTEFQGPSTEATMVYFQIEQQEKATAYAAAAKTAPTPPPQKPAAAPSELISDWPADILPPPAGARVVGNGWARCTALAMRDATNEPRNIFRQGETLTMFYEFEILRDMEFCIGAVTIRDKTAVAVHSKITLQDGVKAPARVAAGTRLRFRQDTVLNLHCADYTLDVSLDMIAASFAEQAGVTYEDFMSAQLRICELPSIAGFGVRLRTETAPFQLLHFGMAGLPSQSVIQVLPTDS